MHFASCRNLVKVRGQHILCSWHPKRFFKKKISCILLPRAVFHVLFILVNHLCVFIRKKKNKKTNLKTHFDEVWCAREVCCFCGSHFLSRDFQPATSSSKTDLGMRWHFGNTNVGSSSVWAGRDYNHRVIISPFRLTPVQQLLLPQWPSARSWE